MKNTKRCFVLFLFYDRTGIEAYLEKQAEKGWMAIKFPLLYNWCKSALLDDFVHNYGRPVPETDCRTDGNCWREVKRKKLK